MGFSKFLGGHSKDKDSASAPAPIASNSHLERNPHSNTDSGYGGSDPSVITERTYRPQDASSLNSSDESAPRYTDQDGNIVTTTTTTVITTTTTTSGGKTLGTTVGNHGPSDQSSNFDNNVPQSSTNYDSNNRNQQSSPPIPMRSSLRGTSPQPPVGRMNEPPPGQRVDGPPGHGMNGPPPATRMEGHPPGTHMGEQTRDRSPVGATSPGGRPNFSYPGRGPFSPQPSQPAAQMPPGAQQVAPMSQQHGHATLQGLKDAARGINGASETLRGTFNSAVDRHTHAPPEILAEQERTIQRGREQMEGSRVLEHRGNHAPPKGILKKRAY